jgi:EF hand
MKRVATLVGLAAAVIAFNAAAVGPSKITLADTNRDGALSKAEACAGKTPHVCKRFERIDTNRDGVVTRAEIRAFNNARRAAKGLPPKA